MVCYLPANRLEHKTVTFENRAGSQPEQFAGFQVNEVRDDLHQNCLHGDRASPPLHLLAVTPICRSSHGVPQNLRQTCCLN